MRPADPTTRSVTGPTVEQRVAAVETRLAALEKLLLVATDGSLTINAPKISLQAPFIELKAANALGLRAGNAIELKSGGPFNVASGGSATVKTADLTLLSSGATNLKAAPLVLNGGTRALARVGDAVSSNGAPAGMAGVIATSSSTVLG